MKYYITLFEPASIEDVRTVLLYYLTFTFAGKLSVATQAFSYVHYVLYGTYEGYYCAQPKLLSS